MLGGNEYFATELQAVQGKERYDIKISQNSLMVQLKSKTLTTPLMPRVKPPFAALSPLKLQKRISFT